MTVLLFLDFDGVICDSARECMYSSWIAYHWDYTSRRPMSGSVDGYRRFLALRPYIRSGFDYLTIQHAMENGAEIRGQEQFDAFAEALGEATIEKFDQSLDRVRTNLLRDEPQRWLGLNRLFPFMVDALRKWRDDPRVWILSTKRSSYITAILGHHGVEFPDDRILWAKERTKLEMIGTMLDAENRSTGRHARFLDDQVDHLVPNPDERIVTHVAAWGYLRPGYQPETDGPVLTHPEDVPGLVEAT